MLTGFSLCWSKVWIYFLFVYHPLYLFLSTLINFNDRISFLARSRFFSAFSLCLNSQNKSKWLVFSTMGQSLIDSWKLNIDNASRFFLHVYSHNFLLIWFATSFFFNSAKKTLLLFLFWKSFLHCFIYFFLAQVIGEEANKNPVTYVFRLEFEHLWPCAAARMSLVWFMHRFNCNRDT